MVPAKAAVAAKAASSSSEDSSDSEEEKAPAKAPVKVGRHFKLEINSRSSHCWYVCDVNALIKNKFLHVGSCEAACCEEERRQL